MEVPLLNFVFFLEGLFNGVFACSSLDAGMVGFVIAVFVCKKDLDIVEGGAGLIDLESKVGAFLIENGVLRIDEVFMVQVGHQLITDKLNSYRVPAARLEIVSTFVMTHGKPWATVIEGGLDVKVVAAEMDDSVIVTRCACYETKICSIVETKVKTDKYVFEVGFLIEKTLVFARYFISAKDTVVNLPFLLEVPVIADLVFREMLAKVKVSGFGE